MAEITRETRIIDATFGELADWLKEQQATTEVANTGKHYVYGYKGVQQLFNCSNATACKLIHGKIADAVYQQGRTIVVDADKALELFNA